MDTLNSHDYSRWCRRIVEESQSHAQANLLFDSSIAEPTELLRERINRCFAGPLTSRYRSTFGNGNPFVLDSLAARYDVPRDSITCTTGASSGLAIIFNAYVEPGSHVIVERPYFDFLPALALNHGAQVSFIERRAPEYAIDPEQLAALIRPNTRLVVLTNLNNPTGAHLSDAQLLRLASVAERAGVKIVVDEVYGDFVSLGTAARLSPAFISVNSLTKVYGLFSLKCGWIIAGEEARARINAVYERFEFGLSKVAHTVAAVVLEDMRPFESHWRGILSASQPVVMKQAGELARAGLLTGDVPEFGCMYFPRLVFNVDDVAVTDWLWLHHDIAVAPGSYFGSPGHLRIGFGRDARDVADGMERLRLGLLQYRELHNV
ncbi:pyridoxal phosphate-dependent aminotransferase [Peristeroidobacter soli]|uniref:pyridoxal phosphate-dependent aminotransferase n=1 Tax=Peristeroidobacter soli TaxID=2497877 RepID=UPI00101C3000|nr:pyridoxal phosphate-dependent aminotransferase [Peristeroidobacter soli]